MAGILIVDDSSDTRMRTIRELENYGYRIRALSDARLAHEMIEVSRPDLVLVNRQSVDFDSVSLFLDIREKFPHIPVMLYVLKTDTALKSLNQAVTMAFKERRAARAS